MWNICRAQCPTYWVDKDLFGSQHNSSSPNAVANSYVVTTKPPTPIKPVTTLSPAFWLSSSSSNKNEESTRELNYSQNNKRHFNGTLKLDGIESIGLTAATNGHVVNEQSSIKQLRHDSDELNQNPSLSTSTTTLTKQQQQQSKPENRETNENPDANMAASGNNNSTEYSRAFEWRRPMIEVPPPKQEPAISQYQRSYGAQGHAQEGKLAKPSKRPGSNPLQNQLERSSNESRSPTPGYAIQEQIQTVRVATAEAYQFQAQIPPAPIKESTTNSSGSNNSNNQHHHPEQLGQGASILFDYEPSPRAPSPLDSIPKQSEYHAKFKPFDDYVYVEGEGKFKKQTAATKLVQAGASAGLSSAGSKAWFVEVEERSKQACKYRARSQNGATPIDPDNVWDGVHHLNRKDLDALALATRLVIEDKRKERREKRSASAKPTSRSSQARQQLNSAPPSLRDQHSTDSSKASSQAPAPPKPVPRKVVKVAPNADRNNNISNNIVNAKPPIAPPKKVATTTPIKVDQNGSQQQQPASGATKEKVWIKPQKKSAAPPTTLQTQKSSDSSGSTKDSSAGPKPVVKPARHSASNPSNKAQPEVPRQFDPEPKSVPLRTTQVKSPEELTGIKSPSPESWKVSIEKGGLNWVNGNTAQAPLVNFGDSGPNSIQMPNSGNASPGLVKPVPINASINSDDPFGPLSA